jgi:hypothetical protein
MKPLIDVDSKSAIFFILAKIPWKISSKASPKLARC